MNWFGWIIIVCLLVVFVIPGIVVIIREPAKMIIEWRKKKA
jgi:hypothetical protein